MRQHSTRHRLVLAPSSQALADAGCCRLALRVGSTDCTLSTKYLVLSLFFLRNQMHLTKFIRKNINICDIK